MGRKSLGKGLGEIIEDSDTQNEDSGLTEDTDNDVTRLESVADSKLNMKWDTPEETQKLEVYETTLSKAWKDGIITRDEKDIIDGIRETLGITDTEHREIETQVIAQQEIMKSVEESAAEMESVPGPGAEPETPAEMEFEKEFKNCPKCKYSIEVEYSEETKIKLQCPECGAKGKIPNPYLKKKKLDKKVREEEGKIAGEIEGESVREVESTHDAPGPSVDVEEPVVEEPVVEDAVVEEVVIEEEGPPEPPAPDTDLDTGPPAPDTEVKPELEEAVEEVPKLDKDEIDKRLEEKKRQFTMDLKLKRSDGRPRGPSPETEPPMAPEPSLPLAKRTGDDAIHEMVFMCPHCEAPFKATPTEDPQDIPCPTCKKDVKIIKPITFLCPLCSNEFPSVLQGDSRLLNCPYCREQIELRK